MNVGGRPKGSTSRPQIRDYMTTAQIKELTELAIEKAKTDTLMHKFILEQIYGKAAQTMNIGADEMTPITFIIKSTNENSGDQPTPETA